TARRPATKPARLDRSVVAVSRWRATGDSMDICRHHEHAALSSFGSRRSFGVTPSAEHRRRIDPSFGSTNASSYFQTSVMLRLAFRASSLCESPAAIRYLRNVLAKITPSLRSAEGPCWHTWL